MGRLVWAFEPLDETNGVTGFVEVEDAVADKLIKAGKVQDGWDPEGGELKNINSAAIDAYATRQMKAGGARPKDGPPPKATPDPDPDPPEHDDDKPKAKTGKAK